MDCTECERLGREEAEAASRVAAASKALNAASTRLMPEGGFRVDDLQWKTLDAAAVAALLHLRWTRKKVREHHITHG